NFLSREGTFTSLHLDEKWKEWQDQLFFSDLISIISKKTDLKSSWEKQLKDAAILAGQSLMEFDVSLAYLLNIVALETLLITDNPQTSQLA
ncbi:MAG: hypothetical protein GY760_16365, partial [Deltaproteobacteria bacterium]|nr:hypothetical protein [Deltaproteobacteria bacterium]